MEDVFFAPPSRKANERYSPAREVTHRCSKPENIIDVLQVQISVAYECIKFAFKKPLKSVSTIFRSFCRSICNHDRLAGWRVNLFTAQLQRGT